MRDAATAGSFLFFWRGRCDRRELIVLYAATAGSFPFAHYFPKMVYKKGTLAKRVSRVEARVRNQRPEMRQCLFNNVGSLAANTIQSTNIVAIAGGDAVNERSGNRIKAWRVEVRGIIDPGLDLYLLQGHTNDAISITDFSPDRGPFIYSSQTNTKITEWFHYSVPDNVAHNFKRSKHFKYGLNVKYSGTASSNAVDNILYVVAVNRSTTAQAVDCSIRIWYTDI